MWAVSFSTIIIVPLFFYLFFSSLLSFLSCLFDCITFFLTRTLILFLALNPMSYVSYIRVRLIALFKFLFRISTANVFYLSQLPCKKSFNKSLWKVTNFGNICASLITKIPINSVEEFVYHRKCTLFNAFQSAELSPFEVVFFLLFHAKYNANISKKLQHR